MAGNPCREDAKLLPMKGRGKSVSLDQAWVTQGLEAPRPLEPHLR